MAGAREQLIFVHGLWLTGIESLWLRRRLQARHGYPVEVFTYGTRAESLSSVLDRLHATILSHGSTVHLLGHSLGGRVVLQYLRERVTALPACPVGRAVLLGSPVGGSAAARSLAEFRLGRKIIGEVALQQLLANAADRAPLPREVGVLAGSLPLGLGGVLAKFNEPHDGVVAVSETTLPSAKDQLVLPVSHTGMLLSTRVADAVAHFLRHGHFPRQSRPASSDRKR